MKKILFGALSLLFLFACKNPQNDGGKPSDKKEEFEVNFSVKDNVGGTLTAKVKDGDVITTGRKVVKDKEVVFTATPTDSTYSVESWTLDGNPVAETELKSEKKEYTLKITKSVNVVVKFKKNGSNPNPTPNEEFEVNFSVKDNVGGTLTAKVKDGDVITTGRKVVKDKEVVFTATPTDSTYSVESWTLDGNPVAETELKLEKKEYTLKITKSVNVIVKFKKEGVPSLKDIQIDKIILGYPHISPRDGKTVLGKDLNGETTIEDFEVPAAKFPIQVHHKSEFTVEQAFVTFDGGSKEELTNPVGRTIFMKEYSLVQDKKTSVIIDITGEGYKPLKLTFNVTYKQATKKYVDDLTMISVIKNKGGATEIYGAAGKPIANLKGGQTTIEVTRNDPTMTIFVRKAEGQQAKAEIKLDGSVMAGKDFATGQTKLEVKFDPLSAGKHHIEIKLEKPDYETANYDFYINYKPFLTFKSLTINGKTYNSLDQIKQIALKADDKNPVDISGEVNESGATVYFKKVEGGKWVKFTPPLDLEAGKNLPLTMNAELEGYTTTPFLFRLKREKLIEPIVITKIEVDGNEVAKGGSIEVSKAEAKVNLVVTLKQKYPDMSFTINDGPGYVEFDATGTIATFADFAITKDGELQVKIHASCQPDYKDCEETITIKHKTSAQTTQYIVNGSISTWDSEANDGEGEFNAYSQLVKDGKNWKCELTESGRNEFVVRINRNGKDITTPAKFQFSMKDVKTNKIYFDKNTTSNVSGDFLVFQRDKDNGGRDIEFPKGETDLEFTIYYEDEVVETCHIIVTRK